MTIAIRRPALGSAATAFLAKKHQMLIDGKWVDARSGQTFAVEDPATEEIIALVPAGDKADIDLAVAAARRSIGKVASDREADAATAGRDCVRVLDFERLPHQVVDEIDL